MKKILLSIMAIGLAVMAQAGVYTWTGATSGDWQDASNWSSTPTWLAGELIFNGSGANLDNYSGNIAGLKGITFAAGTPNASTRISTSLSSTTTRYITFTQTGSYITVDPGANANYTISGAPASYISISRPLTINQNGSGNLELSTIVKSTSASYGITKTGTGTLILSGANDAYLGDTAINAGRLLVNNTSGSGTGTGAVSINNGAFVGGSGTVGGNLSLASGAGFVFNADNALTVSGTLAIDNTFGVDNLDIDWNTVSAGTYNLIVNSGDVSSIENWGEGNAATGLDGGKSAWFDYASGSEGLALTVVPEPATIGLFATAAAAILVLRRRIR